MRLAKKWLRLVSMAPEELGEEFMLQKMLSHSTLEMVTHYANLYDVDLREGVNKHSVLATHKSKNSGRYD